MNLPHETLTQILGSNAPYDPTTETTPQFMNDKFAELLENDQAIKQQINVLNGMFATEQVTNTRLANGWVISYSSNNCQINKIGGKVFVSMTIKDGVKTNGTLIYTSNIKPTKSFQGQVCDHYTMIPVGRFTMDTNGNITLTIDIETNYIYLKGSEC